MNVGELVRAIYRCGPRRRTPCDVLRALAEHADDAGTCFPSHALLARKCRVTPRTVLSSITWLVEDGWLTVERGQGMPGRHKRGRTNLYRLNLQRILGNGFSEIVSYENSSPEEVSSGKSCAKPVKPGGKPVKRPSSSEILSHEIHCNPPAPPILYNTQERLKTKAKAEAEARAYDGDIEEKSRSQGKSKSRPKLPLDAARRPSAPVPLRDCVQQLANDLGIDLRRVQ